MPFKAKNNREAFVVCTIHVVKRPTKRSVLVIWITKCLRIVIDKSNRAEDNRKRHFINFTSILAFDVSGGFWTHGPWGGASPIHSSFPRSFFIYQYIQNCSLPILHQNLCPLHMNHSALSTTFPYIYKLWYCFYFGLNSQNFYETFQKHVNWIPCIKLNLMATDYFDHIYLVYSA